MAVFFGLSLCWSWSSPEFPDSSGSGKGRCLALAALGMEFLLQSSFHSRCFLRGSFPHRFFSRILRAYGHKQKKLRFVFAPWRSFSHLMICFEVPRLPRREGFFPAA